MEAKIKFRTEQENFWAGQFGDEYIERNDHSRIIAGNVVLFSKIFSSTKRITSVLELGCNIGLNLKAIQLLMPSVYMTAVEINQNAANRLRRDFDSATLTVLEQSILEYEPTQKFDFVLIKGVLIHMNPDILSEVYKILYKSSAKYICIAEYYNPTPIEVNYRGYSKRLFKRDFAGELLDLYPDLNLLTYGFTYHRDHNFPQDDFNWFLLEKQGEE